MYVRSPFNYFFLLLAIFFKRLFFKSSFRFTTGDFPGVSDLRRLSICLQCGRPGVQSLGWEDLLEKEMATHSSILAWKIPWTEEPGRLQSMGLQRVRHDWATSFLGLTGLIFLHSKGLSRVFSSITVQKSQFYGAQSSLWSNSHIHTCWKNYGPLLVKWCLSF